MPALPEQSTVEQANAAVPARAMPPGDHVVTRIWGGTAGRPLTVTCA
ncbi:hypothetical protein [Lentzea sp. NPDC055074]